jgi:sporulation protein YlmC with PRC-barrel domain
VTINAPAVLTDTTGTDTTAAQCGTAEANASAQATATVTGTNAADNTGIQLETPGVIQLSELLKYDVQNPDGDDLGQIEDMMVDWRNDRLAYAILSFGGILGLGEKWFVIPLDQLRLDPLEQRLIVNAQPERLQNAPGYDPNVLPDTSDPNWDEQIRQYWRSLQ